MAYWQGCAAGEATFVTSNLCPQAHGFNAGVWERLEERIAGLDRGGSFRRGLIRTGRTVWVYCGPVFAAGDRTIGTRRIEVPSGFWKTVLWQDVAGSVRTLSFLFKHDAALPASGLLDHATTLRAVQKATGLRLVPEGSALLDRRDLEAFRAAAED
jgi:endonuclease G, mitochondrial